MDTIIDVVERPQWLDNNTYPFALRSVDVSTGPVTYVDEGSGPVLLFVHAGMWSFIFRDVIRLLRDDFRCVTLDFPGSGLTPPHPGIASLEELSAVLGDFVAALDLVDVTLVVHDLGGLVGLGAAARDRDRFVGIVMANTFGWTPESRGLRTMLRVMGGRFVTALDVVTNFMMRLSSTSFGVGRHLGAGDRRAFRGPFRKVGPRRRFHHLMRSVLAERQYTDFVAGSLTEPLGDLPVLSVFGERNDQFGFQGRVASTWADHEGLIIERGNHFPMCDDPSGFADAVASWHARRIG